MVRITHRQRDQVFKALADRTRREILSLLIDGRKTVARMEQGKVTHIQKTTLESLAKHLSVEPEEIASF